MKKFNLFMAGQFVSQFGSKLTSYGLLLWAYSQTGKVLSLATLSVCYLIPEICLNFIAGGISDKWNKKLIMLIADTIAACGTLAILILFKTGTIEIVYLYYINIVLGITDAFQSTASDVTISLLIEKRHYMKASAIQSFTNSFTTIFYPIVATAIYAAFGLEVIFYFDLLSFLFAFITLVIIPVPEEIHKEKEDTSFVQLMFSGIKYLREHESIFALILFMSFVNFEASAYNTNLAPMVLARNGGINSELAVVSSMIGVAGLIGSFFVTKAEKRAKSRTLYIINIMLFSFVCCDTLLGIGRNYYVWATAVFLGNVLIPIMSGFVTYLMRINVPTNMQGRVFSARNTLQFFTIPIGTLSAGVLVDKVFEPMMMHGQSGFVRIFKVIVGSGKGSGNAILYLVFGILGGIGCLIAKRNKNIAKLDK